MHACTCAFPSFYTESAYNTLLCPVLFLPMSARSDTAGYRGLPIPLHAIVWLGHSLFKLVLCWGTFGLRFNTLGSLFFPWNFFCFEFQYIPLSWLSCCLSDCSQFLSSVPFSQLTHWISLSPCPASSLVSLFTFFLGELIHITMIFMLMTLRPKLLSPYFFYETQIYISQFSLKHFFPREYFFRDLKFNMPPSEAHQFPLQTTHLHWFLISDNSFTTYYIVQMRNFSISFRSSYSPLLFSHQALSILSHLHSCGHCLGSGPSVRCPNLGLEIWGKQYKVKGVYNLFVVVPEAEWESGDLWRLCHIGNISWLIFALQHLLVPI